MLSLRGPVARLPCAYNFDEPDASFSPTPSLGPLGAASAGVARRRRAGGRLPAVRAGRRRTGGGLSQPALDRQPDRVPAQAAAQGVLIRRRAARRIRRGAAQL